MKCPICAVELKIAERQGIEIDYCPQCRGVWLDRGELDKMIERSMTVQPRREPEPTSRPYRENDSRERERYGREHDDDYKKRKRKSFLGDLFDFN